MSTAGHLTWLVPGNEWDEEAEVKTGKGKRKKVQTKIVTRSSGPRQFDRSRDAYLHARAIRVPLRDIEMVVVRQQTR